MIYIIAAILIFGVLIAVHELGHFLAAKACGVRVNEFAIGMGPALLKKTKGDTQYSLRLLPIGGFCAMEGEDGDSDNPRAFTSKSWWRRLIILAAGSFMNFLAGVLVLVILFQPEFRRGLEQLGRKKLINYIIRDGEDDGVISEKTIYELVKTAQVLSANRTGALIVIENEVALGEYIDTGIPIDAVVTNQLLLNIFEHNTPLHDGAVIIRKNRVVSATCYLPLSANDSINKELGTRHRAGICLLYTSPSPRDA